MQIMADVTGRSIEAVDNPQEAGALGCALAVGVGLGVFENYPDIKKAVKVRATFEPDPKRAKEYRLLYEELRRVYPAMSKTGRRLNAI